MAHITDVAVIGSGALGCATAYYLAQSGVRRVTIVEKGPLVSGMTRRNAGLVHTHFADPILTRLALNSLDVFHHWSLRVGGTSAFNETGLVASAETESDALLLRERVAMQRGEGVDTRLMPRTELEAMLPQAEFSNTLLGAFEPHSGYADPIQTSQTFVQLAREQGATILTGTLAKYIVHNFGHVAEIETTTGKIEAPVIVITASALSARLLEPLGITLNWQYSRGVIGFFERPPALAEGHPTFLDAGNSRFLRPHPYNLSAAGTLNPRAHVAGPEALEDKVSATEAAALAQVAVARLPALADAPLKRAHPILYEHLPDDLPALGPVTGIEGLFVAAGFGEHAFTLSPGVGQLLAEWILNGRSSMNVEAFSPTRSSVAIPR